MDSGELTDVECQRVMRLQELFPNVDFNDLCKRALPHLKSESSFNKFLEDMMDKVMKDDEEDEEEKWMKDKLNFAFTNQIQIGGSDRYLAQRKSSEKLDDHVTTMKKSQSPLKNLSYKDYKSKLNKIGNDCDKNPKKCVLRASLWDNMDDLTKELDEIMSEEPDKEEVDRNVTDQEKGESAVAMDTDSDESFHSFEGESGEKKIENVIKPEEEMTALEIEKKETNSHVSNLKKEDRNNPDERIRLSDVIARNYEIADGAFPEDKNPSGGESDNKKNFAFINGLFSKKNEEIVEKPKEIAEEKKAVLPESVPSKEVDQSKLIDYFFYSSQEIKKEKKDPIVVSSKTHYEKQGAIPKKKNFASESRQSVPEKSAQVYRTEVYLPDCNRSPVEEEKKETVEKKLEPEVREIQDLIVPGYPFVYVVAESYSRNFRLPKGNYLITNLIPKVGDGIPVLLHPTDEAEFRKEDRNSKEKSDGFTIKNEVKTVFNFGTGLKSRNAENRSEAESDSDLKEKSNVFNSGIEFQTSSSNYIFRNRSLKIGQPVSYSQVTSSASNIGYTFDRRAIAQQSKVEPPKVNLKGKIFCNTPLQSLKKEAEDRNDSADAYGAILQSVADDFKSSTNADRSKKNTEDRVSNVLQKSSESWNKKRILLPLDADEFVFRDSVRDEVGEKEVSDEENVREEEEEEDDSSDDKMSNLLRALKNSDPYFIKRKLEECGNDRELQVEVIKQEAQRKIRSDMETEKLNEGYLKILKELPQLDPEYVLGKWSDMVGDDAAIEVFIESEKLKIQLQEVKNKLVSHLPLFDREFLDGKAKEFLYDPEGLESYIAEEEKKLRIDQQFQHMMNQLPGVDPAMLRQKCEQFEGDAILVREFIEAKKLELQELEQKNLMISILQDADPAFLDEKFQEYKSNPGALENLLFQLLESKDYPKVKEEDPASRARSELWRRFVDHFDVKDFLQKTPNPEEYFCGSKGDGNKTDMGFITKFLQSRYPNATVQELEKTFRDRRSNLTNTCSQLDNRMRPVEMMDLSFKTENIPESFLMEMVFILHRREIRDYVREERELRNYKVQEARSQNALLTCACCYEEELLETDVSTCADGHIFCVECVRRSVETKLSDGDTNFRCLTADCATGFTLAILEKILPSDLYGKVLKKRQAAEVTEAKVPGLESCPSCDFAYIPSRDDKIFKCQNSDCLRETCRLCKEVSHVPKRCEEVERPKDAQVRKEIEEKMTEALVRACPKCGKKFVKTDGCNKMTCVCGATSCYLCRKPVTDYSHFNGQGGDKHHLCPLFSNNDDLHIGEVRRVGQRAVDQALRENPDLHLVHDPTKTL